MTPGNIVGMALLNGLQIVALTDHNTTKNCPAFFKAARRHGIIPIPGMELTVENVRPQNKYHPRCGTSFLILMVLVSIFISFFIDPVSLLISGHTLPTALRFVVKFLMIPLIMGIGYELIRLAGKHDNWFTRAISLPGVWLQHLTVLEPTDDMIECAIAAMKEVIPDDNSDSWT